MDSTYSFAIMAFNKLGESGYSGAVEGTTNRSPPPGARHRMIQSVLEERGELPAIVIVTVSAAGVVVLCVNVVMVYCFVQQRRSGKEGITDGGSSHGSSKSATIEMYVG